MAERSDEARARAEATFKKKELQPQEAEKVWAEHRAADEAADTNRAKLKAQRLARDAAENKGKKTKRHVAPASDAPAMEGSSSKND